MVVDPKAEKFFNLSPYVYCHANPLNRIDPDGKTDRWAVAKACTRIVGGIAAWGTGISLGMAVGTTIPLTGGTSLLAGSTAFASMAYGSSQIAFGYADLQTALKTPDGIKAETYGTLINYVGDAIKVPKTAQGVINLGVDLLLGGKDISRNLVLPKKDIDVLLGFVSSGEVSNDLIQILQTIYEQQKSDQNNTENKRQSKSNSEREEEKRNKEDDNGEDVDKLH